MATTVVARYTQSEIASNSAVLRTADTGDAHYVAYDPTTDTYIVTREN